MKKDTKCNMKCKCPLIAILILFIGILWFLAEINVIGFTLPWWPLIIILLAIGMIKHNHHHCKC